MISRLIIVVSPYPTNLVLSAMFNAKLVGTELIKAGEELTRKINGNTQH